jgi:hypothetical protein
MCDVEEKWVNELVDKIGEERTTKQETRLLSYRDILDDKTDPHEIADGNRKCEGLPKVKMQERVELIIRATPMRIMLRKQNKEKVRGYTLYDGCRNWHSVKQFKAGVFPLRFSYKGEEAFFWWEQTFADDATGERNMELPLHLKSDLLGCQVSMITLNASVSDGEAYEMARRLNQSEPLDNSQIMKTMCFGHQSECHNAALLVDVTRKTDELMDVLGDKIWRYTVSIVRVFELGHYKDFTKHISVVSDLKIAEQVIKRRRSTPHEMRMFDTKTTRAVNMAREKINAMLRTEQITPRMTRNSFESATGLIFLALALACANVNERLCGLAMTEEMHWIDDESVRYIAKKFLGLQSDERGDDHRRLYKFFMTGEWNGPPSKGKKRDHDVAQRL